MAGGPIGISSLFHADTAGRTFQNFYAGGGTLCLYVGGVLLAEMGFASPAFPPAVGGETTSYPLSPEESAQDTGRPDTYRLLTAAGELVREGAAGGPGSGAELELDEDVVKRGARVSVSEYLLRV